MVDGSLFSIPAGGTWILHLLDNQKDIDHTYLDSAPIRSFMPSISVQKQLSIHQSRAVLSTYLNWWIWNHIFIDIDLKLNQGWRFHWENRKKYDELTKWMIVTTRQDGADVMAAMRGDASGSSRSHTLTKVNTQRSLFAFRLSKFHLQDDCFEALKMLSPQPIPSSTPRPQQYRQF